MKCEVVRGCLVPRDHQPRLPIGQPRWRQPVTGVGLLNQDCLTPDLGVHVHVCTAGSDWERLQLLFRDWLRYDQSDRAAYNSLKNQLAQEDWPDMNAYAEAKGPLISEITARAEKWARRSGWTV